MSGADQAYRWDARLYASHSGSQCAWGLELVARLGLRGDEAILDVGCGDGRVTAALAERVPRGTVVGLDSSAEMIALANERFGGAGDRRLRFVHRDVRMLEENERFDVVFSNAALHWVRDHRPVLARLAGALKPGGRVLLQMGGRGNAAAVVATVNSVIAGGWQEYFADFTFPYGFHGPEEYGCWLAAAGLAPQKVELKQRDMRHPSPAEFAAWIRTTWLPYLQRVAVSRRQAFLDEIVAHYLRSHPPEADGCVHVAMVRLEVAAVKLNRGRSRDYDTPGAEAVRG